MPYRRVLRLLMASALCALAASPRLASGAVDVRVRGHESLSGAEVRDAFRAAAADSLGPGALAAGADSIASLLRERGHPFARVTAGRDSVDGTGVIVEIYEGPGISLGELVVLPVSDVAAGEPARPRRLASGGPLTREALEEYIDRLMARWADEGRPFASVSVPRTVSLEDGRVSIGLLADPGPSVVFGELVVSGNERTRDAVIAREAGLDNGAPYSASELARARPRVERLSFLDRVSEPVVAVDPASGVATVGLEVVEGVANSISGVLGYAGGADAEEALTGLVDVRLGNIAGTGRVASASWEKIRESQTVISFSYLEPWVLGAPIDLGVSGAQSVRDTFYTTTEGDLSVTARMGDRLRLTWSVGAERYVPGSELESTTTSVRTAFQAEYDATDAPLNPTGGFRLQGGVVYSAKEYAEDGADETSGTVTAGADWYVRFRPKQVLALVGRASAIASTEDEIPFHELLVLGGARSLRGYREEQFRGSRTALATVEYRLLLTRRSRVVAFVDLGYYYRPTPNFAKDSKLGYGIGLRGETRLGTIAVDYGLGEGDGFLDGKLHAGVIREF